MKSEHVLFATLKPGDFFSMSPNLISLAEVVDQGNVVLSVPAIKVGDKSGVPFNVVALKDGRPRTFFPTHKVYKYTPTIVK
jgi:hypothetical protein